MLCSVVPLASARTTGALAIHMDRSGRIRRRDKSHVAPFVFTGIQMLSKRLLRDAPAVRFRPILVGPGNDRALFRRSTRPVVRCRQSEAIKQTEAVLENV